MYASIHLLTLSTAIGEKLKDKVTSSTREERDQKRAKRAEEERQYYEAHQRFRTALAKAQQTGQPQWMAKDKDGKDVYVQPPNYNSGFGDNNPRVIDPYTQGLYSNPNNRFVSPPQPVCDIPLII